MRKWIEYEKLTQLLINKLREHFELDKVEGKQIVQGRSGTRWEIDAIGIPEDKKGIVIIECRRYISRRLSQEHIAAVVYRKKDTEAKGGIVVTPLKLQKGASIIAQHEGIIHIMLDPNSTENNFLLNVYNKTFVGYTDTIMVNDQVRSYISDV